MVIQPIFSCYLKLINRLCLGSIGHIYPSGCTVSWMGYNEVLAGTKASILVLPSDAFGNNLAKGSLGPTDQYFNLSVSYKNGSSVRLADFKYQVWNEEGYISLDFVLTISGHFLVHVLGDNRELRDSPLPLAVKPGLLTEIQLGSFFVDLFYN